MQRMITLSMVGIIAVALGAVGYVTSTSASPAVETQSADHGKMFGHVIMVVRDSQGNIKEYRQTDNTITEQANDCVSFQIFGKSGGNTNNNGCTTYFQNNPKTFGWLAIGSSSNSNTISLIAGQTQLAQEIYAGYATPTSGNRLTSSPSVSLVGAGGSTVSITGTFYFTGSGSTSVQEAGIFDTSNTGSNGGDMFARQTLTTPISVSSGDSLQVTWSITIR